MVDDTIPDSRSYTHVNCGTATVVSGHDFSALTDPFSAVQATFCVACNKHFPLDEFIWDDTQEPILAARRRLAMQSPAWVRLISGRVGCFGILLACVGLGLATGWGLGLLGGLFKWICPIAGALVGAVASVVLFTWLLNPFILRRYYGVTDCRLLK